MSEFEPCLWIIWTACDPFINLEYSFYNLGTAITSIWILFALHQFIDEKFKFRIAYRWWLTFWFKFLAWASIVPVGIGTVLPVIPWNPIPIFGYRIFWEFAGAILFVAWVIGLALSAFRPIKNVRYGGLERLQGISIAYLSKWEQWARILADEIWFLFESFFEWLKEGEETAQIIARIYSDENLLTAISNNPRTLSFISDAYSSAIEKNDDGGIITERLRVVEDFGFLKNLFGKLLENDASIVAMELQEKTFGQVNGGTGIYGWPFLNNPALVVGYKLLSGPDFRMEQSRSDSFPRNYLLFWKKFLEGLSLGERKLSWSEFADCLNSAFAKVSWFIREAKDIDEIMWYSEWISSVDHYMTYGNSKLLDGFEWGNVPDLKLGDGRHWLEAYSDYEEWNRTFLDAIAYWIKGIFDQLARKMELDETPDQWKLRHVCMGIVSRFWISRKAKKEESAIIEAISLRIEKIFEEQIRNNLLWWYPMFLPIFFFAYWYQFFQEFEKTGKFETPFYRTIALMMKEKLPRISQWHVWWAQESTSEYSIRKSKKIMVDLFPKEMEYSPSDNSLTYYYADRESSTVLRLNEIT